MADSCDGITFKVHDVTCTSALPAMEPVSVHVRRAQLDSKYQKLVCNGISHDDGVPVVAKPPKCPNAFVQAAVLAFDQHRPLVLRPQHFWLCIAQAIAMHVEEHAEALKSRLVRNPSDGKKVLKLDVTMEALAGFQASHWRHLVEDRFPALLRAETCDGVVDSLMGNFGCSTSAERVAGAMVVMDALKSFFEYKMQTMCGFPAITLQGSLEDWQALKSQAITAIQAWTLPEFAAWWTPCLTSVLDRLIDARSGGAVDTEFWGSFVKRGCTHGSGAHSWISGWINVFFPLKKPCVPNNFCEPYQPGTEYVEKYTLNYRDGSKYEGLRDIQKGLDDDDFPTGLSSTPVELDGHPLQFRGGFLGVTVDKTSGAVQPLVGWLVASGPPPTKKGGYFGDADVLDVAGAPAIFTAVGAVIPLMPFVNAPDVEASKRAC